MAKHERPTLAALIESRKAVTGESDAAAARSCAVSQATFTRWRSGLLTPTTTERRDALAAWLGMAPDVVTLAVEEGRRSRSTRTDRPSLSALVSSLAEQVATLAAQVEALAAAQAAGDDAGPAARSTPRRLPPNVRPLPPTRR